MRVTIICEDHLATIDGISYQLAPALFPNGIHAVQWYGEEGEIEFAHARDERKPANTAIDNIGFLQPILTAWAEAHAIATAPAPPPTPEELEAAQTKALQDADTSAAEIAAKADTDIQYLRDHTPAECAQFVRSQVNADGVVNLATAQTAIKALETIQVKQAMLLSALVKRLMR